jgi:hypothetical protein
MQLRGKLVTSRLIQEEGEEEENWLHGKLVTSRLIREEGEEEENWTVVPTVDGGTDGFQPFKFFHHLPYIHWTLRN